MRKRREHIDRRAPKLGHLVPARDLAAEHPVAEIFEDDEALVEIEGVDGRRRQAALSRSAPATATNGVTSSARCTSAL